MRATWSLLAVGLWLSGCAGAAQPAPGPAAPAASAESAETETETEEAGGLVATLPNGAEPQPGIYTAGALEPSDLEAAAAAGVQTVIDLRTEAEKKFDEAAEAQAHGMQYVAIQVQGVQGLTRENVERLDAALEGTGPFVVHCGSSNRVGALFALRAAWLEGKDVEEALEVGRSHGLTRLEPAVREKLGEEAAPEQ